MAATTTISEATLWGASERRTRTRERGIHGAGIDEAIDARRLITQQDAVLEVLGRAAASSRVLINGGWLTAEEIARKVERLGIRCPVTSASAQVRNLRKEAGGGHAIAWRYREGTRMAEYRLMADGGCGMSEVRN